VNALTNKLRLYIGLFVLGAILLFLLQVQAEPITRWPELLLFVLLFVTAEARPVVLPKVGLSVAFVIVVVAIISMPPAAVTIASAAGLFGAFLGGERPTPSKWIFNVAQYGLAGGLAASVYRALGGPSLIDTAHLPLIFAATLAATLVYFVVNTASVSGAISLSTGTDFLKTWFGTSGWLLATYMTFGAFGIVLAALYQFVGILALPLLLVPFLVARSVFRSYQEVSQAYESTILAFVKAIEAKDTYTRGHSERVTEYALMIASRLGMEEEEMAVFRYGALLHDVGKLAVRRAILAKPGRLEKEEFDEIKRHPVLGAQIVKEIEFLEPALDGVLYHHEGLAGEVVPYLARIMAVADTFDAMTSTRAYRGARTPEEAFEELRRFSGTQFDPKMVEIFINAVGEEGAREAIKERIRSEATAAPGVSI
jgi:putative nucleotidyltransferase with HDIG domain